MDVLIKFLDGSFKFYKDCDDIDFDINNYGHYTEGDYFDIYENPDTVISLDLKTVKLIDVTYHTPVGDQTDRVYFSKQPVKANNSKKEVKKTMGFDFSKLNHRGNLFTISTEGMEGKKSSEVYKEIGDAPLIMRAIFINKDTGYGESVSVVTNNSIIYFSKSSLDIAREIRENEDAVRELNEKGAYFKITEFESKKFKKIGYSFEFISPEEIPAEHKDGDPVFKY